MMHNVMELSQNLVKNNFQICGKMDSMGILDNLESAWDEEFHFESNPMIETDAMGREVFWQDIGRPEEPNLALKLFSETCCSNCSCKPE